jgi:hypothetical protein
MAEKKWQPSGAYHNRAACENGADYWRGKGYEVRINRTAEGWKHYRRKKE